MRYSIETLPDGKKYIRADRQVIFGNDPESWSEQVEEYINGKIRNGERIRGGIYGEKIKVATSF